MKAGFAKTRITPPLGTHMMGFGNRDREQGCTGVHDDIFCRATYLEHEDECVLLVSLDICFLSRDEADRFKGALGRRLDLSPRRILLNASHNHVGPALGSWCYGNYRAPDTLYLKNVEDAILDAALAAHARAREATIWTGKTTSKVPINRRHEEDGRILLALNPKGFVCDTLPVCLLKDAHGEPISLLFSVSAHPAIASDWDISAEYPGVAMRILDGHLGVEAAQFLQGAGGDAMPSSMGADPSHWPKGTWEMVEQAGATLAEEVKSLLHSGLTQDEPCIRTATREMAWPLQRVPERHEFEAVIAGEPTEWDRLWALKQIQRLDRGEPLATEAILTAQGIRIGKATRMVALEGEPVARHGATIINAFDGGVTFPLGYSNGTGLYLPTSEMISQGGLEVDSFADYDYAAPLAEGMEAILADTLTELRAEGIE